MPLNQPHSFQICDDAHHALRGDKASPREIRVGDARVTLDGGEHVVLRRGDSKRLEFVVHAGAQGVLSPLKDVAEAASLRMLSLNAFSIHAP